MPDPEMLAAILAAGMLPTISKDEPEDAAIEYAVSLYERVLDEIKRRYPTQSDKNRAVLKAAAEAARSTKESDSQNQDHKE